MLTLSPNTRIIIGFFALALVFALLPLLWHGPTSKKGANVDFPHSGYVRVLGPDSFRLEGKKDRILTVQYATSTTVTGGVLAEGSFVQVYGTKGEAKTLVAERIQLLQDPRLIKKP
jgi:hypothetical protein